MLFLFAAGCAAFLAGRYYHDIRTIRPLPPRGPQLDVHVLDSGDGTSQLLVTPAGHTLMIDAGSRERPAVGAASLTGKEGGIDLMVLTSTRARCIGGFEAVLDAIKIKGPVLLPTDSASFRRCGRAARDVLDALHERGIAAVPYDQYLLSHPTPIAGEGSLQLAGLPACSPRAREQSIALRIEYGASSLLYAAGIDSTEVRTLLARESNLACDVLTAPGSASRGATPPELLAATGPQTIIVACGADQPPDDSSLNWMLATGARIGRTDVQGAFTLHLDPLPNQPVAWDKAQ